MDDNPVTDADDTPAPGDTPASGSTLSGSISGDGEVKLPVAGGVDRVSDQGSEARQTMTIVAWAISFALHLLIIILALMVVWSAVVESDSLEVIIPNAILSDAPVGPLETSQSSKPMSPTKTKKRTLAVKKPRPARRMQLGESKSKSTLVGVSDQSSAMANPFGEPVGMGAGQGVSFFGAGGNAKTLVYIVDASGSLFDTMPFVIEELGRSIGSLSEQQAFTVIFFQGDKVIEVLPAGMKRATAANKQSVIRWIDASSGNIKPMGQTDPIKAMRLGFRYKPQLMFILSDNITGQGQYEIDQEKLLKEIGRLSGSDKKIKINTIQFLYKDPLEASGMKPTLQMISEMTGGVYKFLDEKELLGR